MSAMNLLTGLQMQHHLHMWCMKTVTSPDPLSTEDGANEGSKQSFEMQSLVACPVCVIDEPVQDANALIAKSKQAAPINIM